MSTILAIDTATDAVVTGIAELPGQGSERGAVSVRAARSVADHRRHAELLTTLIAESLDEAGVSRADLDAVVVGCGPGPFTGLRVGMATGTGFGDALGLPVYGVCTLDALAAQVYSTREGRGSVVVVTDARRREVYWARYVDGVRVDGPHVEAPAAVAEKLAGVVVDETAGSPAHAELIGLQPGTVTVPTPAGLVAAAAADVAEGTPPTALTPLYLRRPDAVERKDQQRKSQLGTAS